MNIQSELQSFYQLIESGNEDKTMSILHDKLIKNPSTEFIDSLVQEEFRRFDQGHHSHEGTSLFSSYHENKPFDANKARLSFTVTHLLLNYDVDRGYWITRPPIVNLETHQNLVTTFLNKLPLKLLESELLSPRPISFKYDYYSPVSLVFERALKNFKDDFRLYLKLSTNPELIHQIYENPALLVDPSFLQQIYENPTDHVERLFWLSQAMQLLKRGSTIDSGYISGGHTIFDAFARNLDAKVLCPILINHLKAPNRAGMLDVAPIHGAIIGRLPTSILEKLLSMGANPEARMREGLFSVTKRTALEIATKINYVGAIKVLLENNASPNSYSTKDSDDKIFRDEPILTPYQTAVEKGNPQVLAAFFSHKEETGLKLVATFRSSRTSKTR